MRYVDSVILKNPVRAKLVEALPSKRLKNRTALRQAQGERSWILPPLLRFRRKPGPLLNRKSSIQHALLIERLADDLQA
jgi:hypothetical protein